MPSASLDTFTCVDSATADTDTGKVERRHAVIAGHLLQRSERPEYFDAAHRIHIELEECTSAIPRGWWRTPILANTTDDKHLSQSMMRLRARIFYFHLLQHAHLLSMLQGCGEPANRQLSRDICAEASRDLLCRFIKLRSYDCIESYFRLLDHYAWLAAATLRHC